MLASYETPRALSSHAGPTLQIKDVFPVVSYYFTMIVEPPYACKYISRLPLLPAVRSVTSCDDRMRMCGYFASAWISQVVTNSDFFEGSQSTVAKPNLRIHRTLYRTSTQNYIRRAILQELLPNSERLESSPSISIDHQRVYGF